MQDLYVQIDAVPVLLPLWTGTVAVGLAALEVRGRLTSARAATVVVGAGYLAVVLALTFFPLQLAPSGAIGIDRWLGQLNLLPVVTIDAHTFVLNVAMTVPLGLLAPLVLRVATARSAALVGLAVSLTIEACQLLGNLLLGAGRVVDVNDLLANVAGTVLGWLLLQQLRRDPDLDRVAQRLDLRPTAGAGQPAGPAARRAHQDDTCGGGSTAAALERADVTRARR